MKSLLDNIRTYLADLFIELARKAYDKDKYAWFWLWNKLGIFVICGTTKRFNRILDKVQKGTF